MALGRFHGAKTTRGPARADGATLLPVRARSLQASQNRRVRAGTVTCGRIQLSGSAEPRGAGGAARRLIGDRPKPFERNCALRSSRSTVILLNQAGKNSHGSTSATPWNVAREVMRNFAPIRARRRTAGLMSGASSSRKSHRSLQGSLRSIASCSIPFFIRSHLPSLLLLSPTSHPYLHHAEEIGALSASQATTPNSAKRTGEGRLLAARVWRVTIVDLDRCAVTAKDPYQTSAIP